MEEKLGGLQFFGWSMGGLKMPTDDLGVGGGGVFKCPLSSIQTEQHDA